ncbi:hypothetical protein PENTCL1PPCAC_6446, partial [Pristionchus entomophagus]
IILCLRSIEEKAMNAVLMKRDSEIVGETPPPPVNTFTIRMAFEPIDNYSKPIRSIENHYDPVAYCVRTKERHMPQLNFRYDILK